PGGHGRAIDGTGRPLPPPIIRAFSQGVATKHARRHDMTFISNAWAQTAPAAAPGGMESALPSIGMMVLIFVVFYFLLIRPQVKRQKEHKALVDSLNKGDEVLTAAGIVGKITDL